MLYRLNDRRLAATKDASAFAEADGRLRQAVAEMKTQRETELARADLATPCRKALESLHEHWDGLTRFVDDTRIPMDNILYAGMSETFSKRWNSRVISDFSLSVWVVERPARTSSMAARKSANVGW